MESLSVRDLIIRLITLLAIVTSHRKQTLALIKLDNIRRTPLGFEFEVPDRIKTSRPGSCQPLLLLPCFDHMPKLCAFHNLDIYLRVTSELRGDVKALFITITKPYKAASKNTISNWLRRGLSLAGINENFTPHSIRHASTSVALKNGVNMSVIKNLAGWSEKLKTFDKFYNRPIVDNRQYFAEAVLSREIP